MSAGSEQLCMQMPSAPRGRERISMVSGKIEEVSNRFAASPEAVRIEAVLGLSAKRKSLPAWLFYDATGSGLFEQITELPEYYPTRTERALLAKYSDEILGLAAAGKSLSISELGAGTATKTGLLLQSAVRRQQCVFYQPIEVCEVSLDAACENIYQRIPGVTGASTIVELRHRANLI